MYQGKANTVGRMRYNVTIQQQSAPSSDVGSPAVTWSTRYASEPADYEYPRGGMAGRGRQVEEGVDAIFTVRYRDGYAVTDRVVFDGENYGIVFIRPVSGRERYLELHTKLVK